MFDHDFGHFCRGGRIQMSGHSDLGIFSNFGNLPFLPGYKTDTASAACPEHPGSLDMISMTFAAVICDADDQCSVNTTQEPDSSFTISPRRTTRPLYFRSLPPIRHSSNDICPSMMQNELLLPTITSDLLLTFVRFHAEFSPIFPILIHCCFCCRKFNCLTRRNKFVVPNCNVAVNCPLFLRYVSS